MRKNENSDLDFKPFVDEPQRSLFIRYDPNQNWRSPTSLSPIIKWAVAAALLCATVPAYLYMPLRPACDDPEQAYDASKEFVLRRLRAPGTASIAWNLPSDAKVTGLSCRYTVAAYVDAENGFGANARTWYIAFMEYSQDRRQWELSNLILDPPQDFLLIYRGW